MTISRKRTGPDPTDTKIGIGLGAGLTQEAIAKLAGVSDRTVRARKDEPWTVEMTAFTRTVLACSTAVQAEMTAEQIEKEVKKRLGKAIQNYDKALDHEEPAVYMAASDRIFDRAMGKATQKIQQTSTLEITHAVQVPAQLLQAMQRVFSPVADLPVIEGEILDADSASSERA